MYHEKLPYPPIKVAAKNAQYAQAMLSNVGGMNSEMSAVCSYFYSKLVTECDARVSTVFHGISIVEMHHLEIFGKLAMQLGADPRMWECHGRNMVYWSPGYNNYPVEMIPVLKNALSGELAAIQKYEYQARTISDKNITDNLERIIIDEKMHVKIFENLLAGM